MHRLAKRRGRPRVPKLDRERAIEFHFSGSSQTTSNSERRVVSQRLLPDYFLDCRQPELERNCQDPIGQWTFNVLSPRGLARSCRVLRNYSRFGLEGISLNDLGAELVSDFDPGRMIDRGGLLTLSRSSSRECAVNGLDIMLSYPNIYAFALQ